MSTSADSLTLTWEIAAQEAIQANAEEITPSHLFLGLCKLCDRFLPELEDETQGLVQRLRDLDTKTLRRQMRSFLINPGSRPDRPSAIHRNEESKQAFQRAAEIAEIKGTDLVLPEYLLEAILEPIDSLLADHLTQLGYPNLYEQVFPDEIDNDDRLRREAVRVLLKQIGKSDLELQDLLISHSTTNPSDTLKVLQTSAEDRPQLRNKLSQFAEKALNELTHSDRVKKILTETSIDALIVFFAPLGIAVKAITILVEKSNTEDR